MDGDGMGLGGNGRGGGGTFFPKGAQKSLASQTFTQLHHTPQTV